MCYTSSKLQTGILKMKKKKEIEKKDVVAQLVSSGIQIQVLDTDQGRIHNFRKGGA